MKVLLFLALALFAVVNVASATPVFVEKSSLVVPDQAVLTPVAKEAKSVSTNKNTQIVTHKYKVRSGDTLNSIARQHGMTLAALQRLNNLTHSRLKLGQILLLSGKGKKPYKVCEEELGVEAESAQVISPIALPNDNGLYTDSLAEVGVEPIARTYLAIPYRYGAQSRRSTDCSGFVQQVFREFDIDLPRTAREQALVGMKVERSHLVSGDLLFFRTRARKKYPTHVGIYLGNGRMIHASSRQHKVVISNVNDPYFLKRFVGAKRPATFLPGEIDLEMLARQVTGGADVDLPLAAAIAVNVGEEIEAPQGLEGGHQSAGAQSLVLQSNDDGRNEDRSDDSEDIDSDVEPEAVEIISAPTQDDALLPPTLHSLAAEGAPAVVHSPEDKSASTDYAATTVSPPLQPLR